MAHNRRRMNHDATDLTKVSITMRVALTAFALFVLSSIVPISVHHWHTGNACPMLGPIPACYVVSLCYAAMALASIWWQKRWHAAFYFGATPVILLALSGTLLELSGRPTCPDSESGVPLCFYSLAAGLAMLTLYLTAIWLERARG